MAEFVRKTRSDILLTSEYALDIMSPMVMYNMDMSGMAMFKCGFAGTAIGYLNNP